MEVQEQPRLMSLPPELRIHIYETVFAGCTIHILSLQSSPGLLSRPPGLLLSCKQAYTESIDIYYAKCTFSFSRSCHRSLIPWIKQIGASRVRDIQVQHPEHNFEMRGKWDFDVFFADRAGRFLEKLQNGAGLPPGVLKVPVTFRYLRTVWISEPVELLEKSLKPSSSTFHHWPPGSSPPSWIWMTEPSPRLKQQLPFIRSLLVDHVKFYVIRADWIQIG